MDFLVLAGKKIRGHKTTGVPTPVPTHFVFAVLKASWKRHTPRTPAQFRPTEH